MQAYTEFTIHSCSLVCKGLNAPVAVLLQAYAAARAAAGGRELSEAEKWEAGVAVVEALGDPESATR